MRGRIFLAVMAAICVSGPCFAHGGGGGGGHSVYVPIIVGVGGRSPALPEAEVGDYSHIHTIAVLSSTGQTLTVKTGSKLLGHSKDLDVSGWKLDDLATVIVERYLRGHFETKRVAFDRAALAAVPDGSGDDTVKALSAFLASVPAAGVDAFLVIRPDAEIRHLRVRGLELHTGSNAPTEWLGFEIDIVDAHSLRPIAKCYSRAELREGTGAQPPGFMMPADRNVGDTLQPTDVQLSVLRKDFEFDLENTLIETLRPLQMGLVLPDPAARQLVPMPAAMKPYQNVKSVAVVSALGDRLDLAWRGTMFRHDVNVMPIPAWNLDSEIEAQIKAALDKRFTVKSVAVDRAKLSQATFGVDSSRLPTPVDGLTATSDVDAYIVVLKQPGTVGPLSDAISGLGVWKQVPFDSEITGVFANYAVALVDAHTLRPVRWHVGLASPHWPSATLYRTVSNALCPADATTLTSDQQAGVHTTITDIMSDSLGETLLRMGLTGMMTPLPDVDDKTVASEQTATPAAQATAAAKAPSK
jgi:hypothetical protein